MKTSKKRRGIVTCRVFVLLYCGLYNVDAKGAFVPQPPIVSLQVIVPPLQQQVKLAVMACVFTDLDFLTCHI